MKKYFKKFFKTLSLRRKKRIVFCFFSFKEQPSYTPMDVGYILSLLKNKGYRQYEFELFECFFDERPSVASDYHFNRALEIAERIQKKDPSAIFFFLDNILWAKSYAIGEAEIIAKKMKGLCPDVFLGIQSFKFHLDELRRIFSKNIFDCAIGDAPENSFLEIEKIMNKLPVAGAYYTEDCFGRETEGKEYVPGGKYLDDYIPSPYLEGVLDDFLLVKKEKYGKKFTAYVYSSRGCPFACHYCARSVKYEKMTFFSVSRFYDEIEYLNGKFGFLRFFVLDDVFLLSSPRLDEFLSEFESRKKSNANLESMTLNIMTRVEFLTEEAAKKLRKLNVTMVQMGLQTVNPALQHFMNRKVPLEAFKAAAVFLENNGIGSYVDIICGLPGDDLENFKKTVDFAVSLDPREIQIKQLYFCPNTLFFLKKDEYAIRVGRRDNFNLPLVSNSIGKVGERYYQKADFFIEKTIRKHPEILWKVVTQRRRHQRFDGSLTFGLPKKS